MKHPIQRFAEIGLHRAMCLLIGLLAATGARAQGPPPAFSAVYQLATAAIPVANVAVDAAGNTYAVGSFQGTATIGTTATGTSTTLTSVGDYDGFIARYSPTGTLDWVRQLGTVGTELVSAVDVDAAGNVYVSGLFVNNLNLGNGQLLTGTSGFSGKVFIARYSPQGVAQWARQGNTAGSRSANGTGLHTDAAGNVYVTGLYQGGVTFGTTLVGLPSGSSAQLSALFLVKYDNAGTLLWARRACDFLTIGGGAQYYQPSLAVSPAGEAFVLNQFLEQPRFVGAAGTTLLTPVGDNDALAAKFDTQGNFQWAAQIGGLAGDNIYDAAADAAGNLYLTGQFGVRATTVFGASGPSIALTGSSYLDGYVLRLNADGTLSWAYNLSAVSPGTATGSSLCLDAAGNVYVLADFTQTLRTGSTVLASSRGGADVALVAYTPQGQRRWVQQIGGQGGENSYFGRFDGASNLLITGTTDSQPCRFGAATSPVQLSAVNNSVTFLARLNNAGVPTAATAPRLATTLALAPNPATTEVRLVGLPPGTAVQVLDALGRLVRHTTTAADASIVVQGLPAGLYTVRATDAHGQPVAARLQIQ